MQNYDSESIKLFVKNLEIEKNKEKEIIYNILNDSSYMNTLIKKLKIDSYVFDSNGKNNAKSTYDNLSFLYKIVNDYARDNKLYPIVSSLYSIYYVEYNNYILTVFKKNNAKNTVYGCYACYLAIDQLPYCLKFDDIKNNNAININNFARGLVKKLIDTIDKLYCEGFPLYFIHQLVDNIIDNLEQKDEKIIKK